MLDTVEILVLANWCAARSITWRPVSSAHLPAVLLEPSDLGRCWQRMLLTYDQEDFQLVTEQGEPLASASDLHSVLDALEGGVAETAVLAGASGFRPRPSEAATFVV